MYIERGGIDPLRVNPRMYSAMNTRGSALPPLVHVYGPQVTSRYEAR
jgi:hypothetical protein